MRRRVFSVILFVLGLVLTVAATAALIALLSYSPAQAARPDAPPFAKRGPYVVGTRELKIEDPKRALDVAVWYPATNPDGKKEETTYRFLVLSTGGRAIRDAAPEPAGGPYPLIVFSHGLGGAKYQSLYYVEHLASWGFVVIAADHPGSTFGGITADSVLENFALRPNDVLRQITYAETLTAPGGLLAGLIDLNRVAVTGHSFGGYTAISAGGARLNFTELKAWCDSKPDPALNPDSLCGLLNSADKIATLRGLDTPPDGLWEPTSDPRIKAVLLQAPSSGPAFGASGLAAVTVPTMVIVGSRDSATIPQRDAFPMYEGIRSDRKALAVLQNADHYIFVDACVPALIVLNQYRRCSDSVWDMDRAHDLINHLATAFFLTMLKDDAKAANALEISSVTFPGVDYRAVWQ